MARRRRPATRTSGRSPSRRASSGARSRRSPPTPTCARATAGRSPPAAWRASTASPTSTARSRTAGATWSRSRTPALRPTRRGIADAMHSEPIVIGPGDGEIIGDAPDRRVEILSDHPALHVTWSRFAAGPRRRRPARPPPPHRLFFVLDGELTLRLGIDGRGRRRARRARSRACRRTSCTAFATRARPRCATSTSTRPARQFAQLHARAARRADAAGHLRPASAAARRRPPDDGGGRRRAADPRPTRRGLRGDAPGGPRGVCGSPRCAAIPDIELDTRSAPRSRPVALRARRRAGARGRRPHAASAGRVWLQLAPGMPYAVACGGPGAVRYLDLRAPAR